ncbi:ADP-ribosylglycohydrolase family protein [Aquifex aeolicus]|uniref:ADP-ribosylglycohydrolase n=1 Tax=Aquifex aeolicus (strain VF5) TaxID=224324 RepID=O66816_AQUAE|nr:ADP-ribosylglycohydrolase family protein [Aquifex aeolicus]AAC06773.1 ADP-ribosylglycohydrolase [Aquifex aeolicus VF5]
MDEGVKEKFIGAVLGAAVGDALGKSVEDITEEEVFEFYGDRIRDFVTPHPSSPAYGQLPEETSDETTIFRLLLESLVEKKALDVRDFLNRLMEWYDREEMHRYPDPMLLTAIDLLSRGINPSTHGLTSFSVEGILRSVALGLYHYYNPELAAEGSKVVSLLTHRSDVISDASAILGALIAHLVRGDFYLEDFREKLRLIETLKDYAKEEKHKKILDRVAELLMESADLETAINTLGNGTFAFEAFPLALYIFLSNVENPEEALFQAVNSYGEFGGDTDAIGFLVGAMLGAYYGEEAIPYHLRENVENSQKLRELAERLYEVVEKQVGFSQ